MGPAFALAMAGAASAHQAATASREETGQQRTDRTRRTSADLQLAQKGATSAATASPSALDSLSRLQQLADASPQVVQLRRLQALAHGRFAPVAQLAGGPEEEELVQGKFGTAQLQPQLQQAPRANNTGLPDQLKSGIETLSGLSMDHVRVHYNSSQPAQLNALAFAQGSDIHLAPGQEKHLPHEAWHVVQQKQGRVKPTVQMKGSINVNDDSELEKEADVMGEKGLQASTVRENTNAGFPKQFVGNKSSRSIPGNHATGIVQRRTLLRSEKEQLEKYIKTAISIEADYKSDIAMIKETESNVLCSALELKEFDVMITEAVEYYDIFFTELTNKKSKAHQSDKAYDSFIKHLNIYTSSGGKNKLVNLKKYVKRLPKEDNEKVDIPSVVRFSDYLILVKKLYVQADLQSKKLYPLPDILKLTSDLGILINKVEENDEDDWGSINSLHHQISGSLEAYPKWNSAVRKQFIELRLIDSKKKVGKNLLEDIGSINVASRSNKSEGYYMRSQNVHKMHIGNDEVTPFIERTGKYLEEGAKVYNIGGAKMMSDTVMVQKDLRRGRKKVSSKKAEGLRDDILEHKNKYVKFMVDNFGTDTKHLKAPKAQLDAQYPCVLILFEKELMNKVSKSKDNIPEFLTHLVAGHVNAALTRSSLRPLVDRRQSFGFMTPTITDVHSGVRLSLGITPSEDWCHAVIEGIKVADADIDTYDGFKSVPGNTKEKDPDFVIMNKFNQGSVLGAGHKLITEKLLSEGNKTSITRSEINTIFGTREGSDVVKDILNVGKPDFDGQTVDQDSIALYKRLKSFYERLINISGGEVENKEVVWVSIDPGEKLQDLMDIAVEAVYDDSKNIVDLDESSDEEDREPSRVPSGMSALFLPIASYSSIHEDENRSIIYDTAPFSYFEIDGSWKRTFKLDYIERLGVRCQLVTSAFKEKALKNFDKAAEEDIIKLIQPHYQAIKIIKEKGNEDEENIRDQFRLNKPQDKKQQEIEADRVELKIEKIGKRVKHEVDQKETKIRNLTHKRNTFFSKQKDNLEVQLEACAVLMNSYMECKAINPRTNLPIMPKKLKVVTKDLNSLMTKIKKSDKESNPSKFVASAILDAFEKVGFGEMEKAVNAKAISNVEVAFVDVNPCMTDQDDFDSGENLYHQTMQKYDKLRMIVVDITSSTEKQVNDLISLFQDQSVDRDRKEIVPFLCLAKSGTKHDQMGLDISTMGRCHYIMHDSFQQDKLMLAELRNLNSASRSLSNNTEPLLVKKLRRDLRKAAQQSEK
jgi:hypothetical protein